jgi:hypothetical protein
MQKYLASQLVKWNIFAIGLLIGMINYYRDMWARCSELLAPLSCLTSKNVKFQWTEIEQQAFEKIKNVVC